MFYYATSRQREDMGCKDWKAVISLQRIKCRGIDCNDLRLEIEKIIRWRQ